MLVNIGEMNINPSLRKRFLYFFRPFYYNNIATVPKFFKTQILRLCPFKSVQIHVMNSIAIGPHKNKRRGNNPVRNPFSFNKSLHKSRFPCSQIPEQSDNPTFYFLGNFFSEGSGFSITMGSNFHATPIPSSTPIISIKMSLSLPDRVSTKS